MNPVRRSNRGIIIAAPMKTPKSVRPARRQTRSAETPARRAARARSIVETLLKEFPDAATALSHENPLQLLVATILSAQCTDERVNKVTPGLFQRYPTARDFAAANQAELEAMIHSTGFFRNKAKNIIACCQAIVAGHGGEIPAAMDALVKLPGVGRKTANVVLGQSFGIASGVVVDTHVQRLAKRMGFTVADDPLKIEQDLMNLFPEKDWIVLGSVLILHGRKTCDARKPKCDVCSVATHCPAAESFLPSKPHKASR
jgi:endonuclease III